MSDDSDDFGQQLNKQKEELVMNDAWGTRKKNFYGRDKKRDDATSSEDDEDEYKEAMRLQKVRAQKLQKQMAQQEQEVVQQREDDVELESEDSDSSEDFAKVKSKRRLGDRLFAEDENESAKIQKFKAMMHNLDPKSIRKIVEKEYPELQEQLEEYQNALITINKTLKPVMENDKLKKASENKQTMAYVRMKYNLMVSYCTFLSFYLLMKIEGKVEKEHPVLFKIKNIKTLLDSLNTVDEQIEDQLNTMVKSSSKKAKKGKVQKESDDDDEEEVDDDEESIASGEDNDELNEEDQEDSPMEGSYDEEAVEEGSQDMVEEEVDISDEDVPLTKAEKKQLKAEAKQQLRDKLDTLDDDSKDMKAILKKAKKSKKKSRDEPKEEKSRREKDEGHQVEKRQRMTFNDIKVNKQVKGDEVYEDQKAKMREKKAQRKQLNKEHKQQELEQVGHMNKDIQRNINYTIMKSKGLTRKRKKIDRNSRVKHREKYRKALIKRGSKVQTYKEGPKAKYGGEATGLKSSIIKSTKLT